MGQPASASWPAGREPQAIYCTRFRSPVPLSPLFFGLRAKGCTCSKVGQDVILQWLHLHTSHLTLVGREEREWELSPLRVLCACDSLEWAFELVIVGCSVLALKIEKIPFNFTSTKWFFSQQMSVVFWGKLKWMEKQKLAILLNYPYELSKLG